MKKTLFSLLLISILFPISSLRAEDPVPVQIPEEELTPDVIEAPAPNPKKTEKKAVSILKNDSSKSKSADSAPVQFPIVEEIPDADPQPISEEIPASAPRPVAEESLPVDTVPRTPSGLIPFNPSQTVHTLSDPTPEYIMTEPENFLLAIFQKYQFPYAFIQVDVLHTNAESQQLNNQFVQLQLPLMISFNTEEFAAFQAELEGALEIISSSFQNEVAQARLLPGRKMIREAIMLNVPDGTGKYKSYALPQKCRGVLAQYAALVPVGKVTLYDANENALQSMFFPILYRDIVNAFPINLLEDYQGDHQTIRILEQQNEPFMEFIQNEGKSFVIPDKFPVVQAQPASAEFLEKQAKAFYLEPVFRRSELLPQIPMTLEMQLPMIQFQNIRFMNCEIMTDQPGEAVVRPEDRAAQEEADQADPLEPEEEEELPFILEEIPVQ